MSKELEALNKIQHDFGQLKGQELLECYELISKGLQRLAAIDEAQKLRSALMKIQNILDSWETNGIMGDTEALERIEEVINNDIK